MVDSFRIRNFRGFDEVEVKGCRQINVIVGDNGSGKTAMLEALFLAAGVSPELVLRTRVWRGQETERMSGNEEELISALWADIFYNFQENRSAVITLKGQGEQNREVSVKMNPPGKMKAIPPPRNKSGAPVRLTPEPYPIEFRWDIRGIPSPVIIRPHVADGRLVIPPSPLRAVKAAFYAANRTPLAAEAAVRFSRLSQKFEQKSFIAKFESLYPAISDISIEISGGIPSLFGESHPIPQKLPLTTVSGGMNKIASILLAMVEQEGGIILIDEVESGFYHKRLPEIWRAIVEYSRSFRCQVFASTHSDECLRSLAQVAKESPDDFSLIRTVRTANGSQVRHFDGPSFSDAVLDNVDVR